MLVTKLKELMGNQTLRIQIGTQVRDSVIAQNSLLSVINKWGALLFFGFALRLFVAIWSGFFAPSFGADLDALSFHLTAVEYAQNPTLDEFRIGWIYTNFLGLFYYVTTDSLFLGNLLSCIAWLGSALILASCLRILSVERSVQAKVMLVYALLPSSIMFTAVTLREPYQLLFVNLAIYAVLKIYLHRAFKHWFTLIFAIIGTGSLHAGLLAFGILLFAGTLLLVSMRGKKEISWPRLGLVGAVAAVVLWYGFSLFGNIFYNLDEGLGSVIEVYQQGALGVDARAHYKSDVQISGLGGLLIFMPVALFQYLFEPFPWHISAASDIVLVSENILRGWLIWKAWKAVYIAPAQQRRVLLFVFISYLVIETIWSIGTINWGTAVRHHLPAWGLLLLAAYAASDGKVRVKKTTQHFQHKVNSAKV